MPRYIRGDRLPLSLQRDVLARYVHRWTHENARQTYGGRCPGCAQAAPFPMICGQALPHGPISYTEAAWHAYHMPLTSDAAWLAAHAFAVNKDGQSLNRRQSYAHDASRANGEGR